MKENTLELANQLQAATEQMITLKLKLRDLKKQHKAESKILTDLALKISILEEKWN